MAGIYLHVPFCHAKCAYCDFYSVARPSLAEAYAGAVASEYSLRCGELAGEPVNTLYFGGGTPSILPADVFKELAQLLRKPETEEFTIEVNPEDVDAARVRAWKDAGVNRVSIGVQSLNDAELRAVNRRHSAARALEAIEILRRAGITNISADLIYGLPGQTALTWTQSVRDLAAAGITHISAYCLSFEPGTLLTRRLEQGLIEQASEDLVEEMYGILCRELAARGFEHYEISNFALPGCRSRHNSAYWRGVSYLGLGPGAHSLTASGLRRFNPSDIKGYIAENGDIAQDDYESGTDVINDTIMIRMRTAEGLEKKFLATDALRQITKNAAGWIDSGHLRSTCEAFYIPEESWLLADAIIRDMFLD